MNDNQILQNVYGAAENAVNVDGIEKAGREEIRTVLTLRAQRKAASNEVYQAVRSGDAAKEAEAQAETSRLEDQVTEILLSNEQKWESVDKVSDNTAERLVATIPALETRLAVTRGRQFKIVAGLGVIAGLAGIGAIGFAIYNTNNSPQKEIEKPLRVYATDESYHFDYKHKDGTWRAQDEEKSTEPELRVIVKAEDIGSTQDFGVYAPKDKKDDIIYIIQKAQENSWDKKEKKRRLLVSPKDAEKALEAIPYASKDDNQDILHMSQKDIEIVKEAVKTGATIDDLKAYKK